MELIAHNRRIPMTVAVVQTLEPVWMIELEVIAVG
jgi:hypothetical protein